MKKFHWVLWAALGSKVSVAMTAVSRLDWRRQCLKAGKSVRRHAKGPKFMSQSCIWQTSLLEDLRVCREYRKEKSKDAPRYPAWGDGRMAVL